MKYFSAILCAALLCAALVLAGCNNILTPSGNSPNAIKESGVRITVSGGQANPRTLFPTAHFFKYRLSFSGPAIHNDIFLENGATSALVNDLAEGNWTITATGYVKINGTEYPAAEGSGNITVTLGSLQSVNVPLSARQDGARGYFSYAVNFPSSRVNDAYLEIYSLYGGWGNNYNLYNNPSGLVPLDPGYYLMNISLYNEYETAGITEVVHIYANMETQAHYTFTDADFTDFITVSGTIDVKVGGQVPQDACLRVYLDENYDNYLTEVWINTSDGTWSMRLAAFDTETPLYFRIDAYNNDWFSKEIGTGAQVKDENISDIVLAPVNFNVITISGTVDIQVTGATFNFAYVQVYAGDENYHYRQQLTVVYPNSDGAWSWSREPFDNTTNLYFRIEAYINEVGWFNRELDKSITVKDQDRFINLGTVLFKFITLIGAINVTYDGGKQPDRVYIEAIDQDGYGRSTELYYPDVGEPWSITLPSSDTPRNIRFGVRGYDNNGQRIFLTYANNPPLAVTNTSVSGITLNLGDIPLPDAPYNPVALTEAAWVNGDIDLYYKTDWYSINVTAGTTYYLWFNHNPNYGYGYGDGSQSLYGEVYATYGDGTEIFNTSYAWYDPEVFTADSSGKVYIRVRGRWWNSYTGTYELIYSTAANRPVRGADNYVVTFNTNGGSAVNGGAIPSRNVVSGVLVNKPADPVKEGFRFGGWYREAALTNPWNFAADTVSTTTTLYAKWNEKIPGTVVVAFEGFGNESIDLTSDASSISRSKGQGLYVFIEGEYDSYPYWYIDGNNRGTYWWDGIHIYASDLPVGIHTVSAVVNCNGKPYSKELTFRVVH